MNDMFGPMMIDVDGIVLTAEDIEILRDPLVGGVILFARNYRDKAQVTALCARIREVTDRPLLIAVDWEGGRVQRFGEPFTNIPAMQKFGRLYDTDPHAAANLALATGQLLADELSAVGIDFSFTPVLDLDRGISAAIGDRAFHRDPGVVSLLATKLLLGLRDGGVAAVAKHFPGLGGVVVDPHIALPVDTRREATILGEDIEPFRQLIRAGVAGVMPSHVIYQNLDPDPAGFSSFWLKNQLRDELKFDGAIFTDDLSMQATHASGDVVERVSAAAAAGCDMLLLCNDRAAVITVLSDYCDQTATTDRQRRLRGMQSRKMDTDIAANHWQTTREQLALLSRQ
jgi:beta-N-acetylhexosaminidase